mmetsp:Transcript_11445/g.24701  ORF Transcript_11445/g.24701 Transcript_11445/m.24701 type:complete len:121 (-) Transcript_11445:66-428(-)
MVMVVVTWVLTMRCVFIRFSKCGEYSCLTIVVIILIIHVYLDSSLKMTRTALSSRISRACADGGGAGDEDGDLIERRRRKLMELMSGYRDRCVGWFGLFVCLSGFFAVVLRECLTTSGYC